MHTGRQLVPASAKAVTSNLMSRLQGLGLKPAAFSLLTKRILNSQMTHSLAKMGQSGFSRAKQFRGEEISTKAILAAKFLKRRTRPEKLNKDYRHFLHLTQEIGYDRGVEKLFFVPAKGYTALDDLTIDSPNKPFGHDYHPIHRLSFNWAMAQIPDRLDKFTFVDYGAGRGRALMLAAMHPFNKIIGVEFAAELQDDAVMNIAQFPRSLMKCRDVDCLHRDAVDFPIPETNGVFLFNDSFDLKILETVLARITTSYRSNPRRIYLVFVRPPRADLLDQLMERTVIFEPTYHSKSEKIRMQILSPAEVQIFRTLI